TPITLLCLHDALPILKALGVSDQERACVGDGQVPDLEGFCRARASLGRSPLGPRTTPAQRSAQQEPARAEAQKAEELPAAPLPQDRKSTRLNSSHVKI